MTDSSEQPDEAAAVAEEISFALLVVLETLSPAERAVFVLREAFGFDYPAIAAVLDRSEAACRQLASRARNHVEARRPRYEADPADRLALLERFLAAGRDGDLDGLVRLLADDVVLTTDGGGVVAAALRPVVGPGPVARFVLGVVGKVTAAGSSMTPRWVTVNGAPGLVVEVDGVVDTVVDIDVAGGRISALRFVRNPEKLTRVRAQPPDGEVLT